MTAAAPRVAAVIPAFEEEGAIGLTVRNLPRDLVADVIVVDGGSRDGTVAEAEAAGAIVVREGRRGYGRACRSGVEHAARRGAEIVLFLDGDGSDAGERAALIVRPVIEGQADLVLAWRSASGRQAGSMGIHQVAAGHLLGVCAGLMTGTRFHDMCAFRAIRLETLERLSMREMTYGWNLEMQVRAAALGLRIREVPMPYRRRAGGVSKVSGSLRTTARVAWELGRVMRRTVADARRPVT